jgi:ribosomal protein L40E
MKKYCFKCGAKSVFSAREKPKFCQKCGTALDPSDASEKAEDTEDTEDSEELEEAVQVKDINIDALDFEFDKSALSVRTQKIEEVMGTLDESQLRDNKEFFPIKRKETSREEFKKEFQKEAGTLKPGEDV